MVGLIDIDPILPTCCGNNASEVPKAPRLLEAASRDAIDVIRDWSGFSMGVFSVSWSEEVWAISIYIFLHHWVAISTEYVAASSDLALINKLCEQSITIEQWISSVTSFRCFLYSRSCPLSPTSSVSTQYSGSPLYLQFLQRKKKQQLQGCT